MNDKLVQDVAHIMREYYDNRGNGLEKFAQDIVSLFPKQMKTQPTLMCEITPLDYEAGKKKLVQHAAANVITYNDAWTEYMKYVIDEIGTSLEKGSCVYIFENQKAIS